MMPRDELKILVAGAWAVLDAVNSWNSSIDNSGLLELYGVLMKADALTSRCWRVVGNEVDRQLSFPVAREDLDPLERVHGKTAAQIAHLSARSIKAAAEKLGLLDSMQARVNFDKMSDEEKATLLFLAVTGQPQDPLLKEMDLAMDDVRGTCIGQPNPGALCQYGLSALSP